MSIVAEITALKAMSIRELREQYYRVFGEASRSRNKESLFKRIAYRIQERAEGTALSERAVQRIAELARDEDLRVRRGRLPAVAPPPPLSASGEPPAAPRRERDPRVPPTGTVLHRSFGGSIHEVRVLDDGFEYRAASPFR